MKNKHAKHIYTFIFMSALFVSLFGGKYSAYAEDPCYFTVDEVCYASLSAAHSAVSEGGTIVLEEDIQFSGYLASSRTFSIDLNDHYFIGMHEDYTIVAYGNTSTITIKDSVGDGVLANLGEGIPVAAVEGGTIVVESGTITTKPNDETNPAIYTSTSGSENSSHVYVKGGTVIGNEYAIYIGDKDELIIDGGSIMCYGSCILNNGSITNGTRMTINGGTIKQMGNDRPAIYHPGPGNLTINGGQIIGGTGVEMRAGSLTITDGIISAATDELYAEPNGSGNTVSKGAAIAISQHTTQKPISIDISGGVFLGYYAFYQANIQGNPEEAVSKISANISGGIFAAGNESGSAIHSENLRKFISGGNFLMTNDQAEDFVKLYMDDRMTAIYDSDLGIFVVEEIIHPEGLPTGYRLIMAHEDLSDYSDEEIKEIKDKLEAGLISLPEGIHFTQEEIIELMTEEGVGLPGLDTEVKLTVPIDERFSTPEEGYTRKWYVFNEHRATPTSDYSYKLLPATYNSENNTLSFTTNTFSQFYIGFADTEIEVDPEDPTKDPEADPEDPTKDPEVDPTKDPEETPEKDPELPEVPSVPDTSAIFEHIDNIIYIIISLAIVSGIGFYFAKMRHHKPSIPRR